MNHGFIGAEHILLGLSRSLGPQSSNRDGSVCETSTCAIGGFASVFAISDEIESPYGAVQTSFDPHADGEWAGRSIFAAAIPGRVQLFKVEWRDQTVTLDL